MWHPLLDSKFDGRSEDLPATYIWSRPRRMSKTRAAAGGEIVGWLEPRAPLTRVAFPFTPAAVLQLVLLAPLARQTAER